MILVPQLEFSFYLSNSFWTAVCAMALYLFLSSIFSKNLSKSIKNRANTIAVIESEMENLKIKINLLMDSIILEKEIISQKIDIIENDYKQKILHRKVESDDKIKEKILNLSTIESDKSFSNNLPYLNNLILDEFVSSKKSIFSAINGKI